MTGDHTHERQTAMTSTTAATVAFLGLGHMGGPMAANLVSAGFAVRGFDPVPAAQQAAAANGVTVLGSVAEAVTGADVVLTMLPNGDLVRSCYADILPAAAQPSPPPAPAPAEDCGCGVPASPRGPR